jgi:hypothetical protein
MNNLQTILKIQLPRLISSEPWKKAGLSLVQFFNVAGVLPSLISCTVLYIVQSYISTEKRFCLVPRNWRKLHGCLFLILKPPCWEKHFKKRCPVLGETLLRSEHNISLSTFLYKERFAWLAVLCSPAEHRGRDLILCKCKSLKYLLNCKNF